MNLEPYDWTINGDMKPLPDKVLVHDMEYGEKITRGGLIILNDDAAERGIRPRWATVYAVGKNVTDVKKGDRVLVSHGRWSRGINVVNESGTTVVRLVETESILGVEEA